MNLTDINEAIVKKGGQVVISQTLNLMTCDNFKLKSGEKNARKLKWEQPTVTWVERLWCKLFNKEVNDKPHLIWDGPRPIFERYVFESLEDFNEFYSPEYVVDENLNVHLKPHIVIWHGNDPTRIYFNTIEEANEIYRLMLDAFANAKIPILINEKFEEKRLSVVPANEPEEKKDGCAKTIPEYLVENMTDEQLENMVDMMERTDKMRGNKQ